MFLTFSSLQTLFEGVVDIGLHQGFQAIKRDLVHKLQKGDVTQNILLFSIWPCGSIIWIHIPSKTTFICDVIVCGRSYE